MRYAGHALTALGGTALGAVLMDSMQGPTLQELNAGKPSHAHYNTQIGHAVNNASRMWQAYLKKTTPLLKVFVKH